jgi:uncharacterized protein (TIGR02466 family)
MTNQKNQQFKFPGLHGLFATPVKISELPRDFKPEELLFISSLNKRINSSNKMSINTYVFNDENLKDLHDFCQKEVEKFVNEVYCPADEIKPYITQSWVNYNSKNEFHHKHYHPHSFVSGVLYINALENLDRVYFHKNNHDWIKPTASHQGVYNSESWFFPVWSKALVLFPSNLRHSVENNEHSHTRVSLSFNTFLEGELGIELEATKLVLPKRTSQPGKII